ncbi:hypothetical protein DFH09DRAFT_1374300 [Mycena vulgaris]|nr:hypothetical protein DFH09DRAFT_1374300 [Mycena vulgaris]
MKVLSLRKGFADKPANESDEKLGPNLGGTGGHGGRGEQIGGTGGLAEAAHITVEDAYRFHQISASIAASAASRLRAALPRAPSSDALSGDEGVPRHLPPGALITSLKLLHVPQHRYPAPTASRLRTALPRPAAPAHWQGPTGYISPSL